MSAVVHARVIEQLTRLRLRYVAERLDALLTEAARTEPTYLDFLDSVLRQEVEAKQRTRVTMALKIAHFPSVKTLDDFDFKFQPSVDQRLVRELATGRFLAQAENVLVFGAPGVGKTHLAIALGRAVVEAGHSVLFTSATALLAALAKAETEGQLADRLLFYSKPKLLIIDELGYLPVRAAQCASLLPARRAAVRARQHADHHEPARDPVGHRLRRRGPRRGDPRPPAPPQPHADDPGRELSLATEEKGRTARQCDETLKRRLWTLPEPWTHRTRPPLLGKPHRTRFPTATTALIFINQEGSVLVSEGGQKILSLDTCTTSSPSSTDPVIREQ